MEKMTYKEKFVQMNKEAKATWIVSAIIIAYWFLSGFGVYAIAPEATIFYMPAWFILSCVGSWILAVVLVIYLVKKVFKNFDLDDDEEEGNVNG